LPRAARAIASISFLSAPAAADVVDQITPAALMCAAVLIQLQEPINPANIEYVSLRDLLPDAEQHHSNTLEERNQQVPPPTPVKNQHQTNDSRLSDGTLRQMELQVTKHFLFTLLPLFVSVIPCLLFGFINLIYFFFDPKDYFHSNATLISYLPYVGLLPSAHVFLYPLANLLVNKDICSFSL
jgi:hypothetical protein